MATELAKAYVQIMPSARGIKGKLTSELNGEGVPAGKSAGSAIGGAIKKAIAAAGIGTALVKTIQEGAKLEQSIGGIETLFKDSADTMIKYSKQAYKTAGLSANEYMETATGFAASLLQGLGGDTAKAADISNMAIMDMSDNANKMGTNMRDIQNAYQGFAKQNYTMLDNLKLGYGGTKSEMERLLADAEKLTGVHYDISNLSDVYSAIHAIQEHLDITGTTALEAEETISGSFNSMKAAAEDFMGALTMGYDIQPYLQELVSSAFTFLKNLVPAVINIAVGLVQAIAVGIAQGMPQLLSFITTQAPVVGECIKTQLPKMIEHGADAIIKFITGLMDNLPAVLNAIGEILAALFEAIVASIPTIMIKGAELIVALSQSLFQNAPKVVESIMNVMGRLIQTILDHLPQILEAGIRIIGILAAGLIRAIPDVVRAIPRIIISMVKAFLSHDWASVGVNIIKGIASGIAGAVQYLVDAAVDAAKSAFEAAKDFLGIHSPSRKFMFIGTMTMQGFAKGILDSSNAVEAAMQRTVDSITNGVEKDISINAVAQTRMQGNSLDETNNEIEHGKVFNQTININQPVKTPAETANELKRQAVKLGLAGGF